MQDALQKVEELLEQKKDLRLEQWNAVEVGEPLFYGDVIV